MSSAPKDGKTQGPPKEKKTPAGPIITPQILGIVFGVILLVGIIAFYQLVVVKYSNELNELNSKISSQNQLIGTYTKKGDKKDDADEINKALKAKLGSLGYLFLEDQTSLIPFFESTLLPMLDTGALGFGPNTAITVTEYTFKINMAMNPFKTLPSTSLIESNLDVFPIEYIGEVNGNPEDTPLDTTPNQFLLPYTIIIEGLVGTYEDAQRFITKVQRTRGDEFITVHCVVNDDSESFGLFRTSTEWKVILTVYFMNPEAAANSDTPPGLPKSESC